MDENKVSIETIKQLVRMEFRRYGFRADGDAPATVRDGSESLSMEFEEEAATGQAGFSQKAVTCHARVWLKDDEAEAKPLMGLPIAYNERRGLELCVQYAHWGSGQNGYDIHYELVGQAFGDPPRLRRVQNS